MFWGYQQMKPFIWAHRGYAVRYPENSLQAFLDAFEAGAHGIECDLQIARDGTIVLAHDAELPGVDGQPLRIKDLDWLDIQALTQGTINRLEDLAQLPKALYINLELKEQGALDAFFVDCLVHIIRHAHWQNRILFSSFSGTLLTLLEERLPDISRAALWASWLPDVEEFASLVHVDAVHVAAPFLSVQSLKRYQQAGYQVAAWSLKDARTMTQWIHEGIDGVIIDNPLWMAEIAR
ncbi:glycerophosphodiester phosphodiesterase [Sulfobacillus thermosulfidooxidans]|uniref:glycerophosphodiester phosphodiesterase n=1 Tax=Sulfobacillus thermosulfidooxidans TaxID=28034 RepID=UPI0006B65438|nr:glycerophosphodiester phosphodiesterase [Sulfobacillus thermosulfidooxidans]